MGLTKEVMAPRPGALKTLLTIMCMSVLVVSSAGVLFLGMFRLAVLVTPIYAQTPRINLKPSPECAGVCDEPVAVTFDTTVGAGFTRSASANNDTNICMFVTASGAQRNIGLMVGGNTVLNGKLIVNGVDITPHKKAEHGRR